LKTYFRILAFVKPYSKYISGSILFSILYALANGASVYLFIPLLDTLFLEKGETVHKVNQTSAAHGSSFIPDWILSLKDSAASSFNNYVFGGSKYDALSKIVILVLLAFFLKNLFNYLQAYFLVFAEQGVVKDIRNKAYTHLHTLPMGYFKNEKTGNLISRIVNDVQVVQASVSTVFLNLVREPIMIVVFLGIAVSISWKLTIFSFIVLPVSLALITLIGLRLRKESLKLQESIAQITSLLYETITGVKIVKAFGMEAYENKKFFKGTQSYFRKVLRMTNIRNSVSPITEFLSVAVGTGIIYYGGSLVLSGQGLKASEFLGFLFAIFQLMTPIKELSGLNNKIQESSAAGDRIFEIIDTEPSIKDKVDALSLTEFKNTIEFKNVSFHYQDSDELVLNDVSFEIKKGSVVALVGPSGSGKSTLVDLLPRFYDPTDGLIAIDGIDLKETKIADLRKLMGIVTQETILFNESIKNNIAYGLEDYPSEKIIEATKTANAHKFIEEFPDGYETVIGERGLKISGGQRQRLSIARALLKNPQIMIFDEATSALDNESEVLVQEAIERLMQDRTTFVIAHRLSTIRNADLILVLDRGKIVQQGTHDDLVMEENGLYKKLYELQFRV